MKVAIYGAGGVGGYFGGRLAMAGVDVHLIARGAHLAALRRHGLRVRSVLGDFEAKLPATDDPTEIGPCDFVLFCVKSYDTESAAARLQPLLRERTAVVSFQNGVDNEEKLTAAVGTEHVMGGVAFIFSTIAEPGVIQHSGGPARIVFGEMEGGKSPRGEELLAACRSAEIDAELSPNIRLALWNKFAFICAAGMTAAARQPIDRLLGNEESRAMFRRMIEEVVALAAAEGVGLPADTVSKHLSFAEGLPAGSYSSLYHDLVHGNRMELEALHGVVARRARTHGLDAPMNQATYALLSVSSRE